MFGPSETSVFLGIFIGSNPEINNLSLGILVAAIFAISLSLVLYLDPGSGSLLIQALLAAILTVPFMFKRFWSRITSFLRRSSPTVAHKSDKSEVDKTESSSSVSVTHGHDE